MIAVKDLKAELKERISNNAKYEKGITLRIITVGDYNEHNIAPVTCRVLKEQKDGSYLPYPVPRMIQVTDEIIKNANATVLKYENEVAALKKAKADSTEAEKALADADYYEKSLVKNSYIETMDNTIFLTTADFTAALANRPETAFIVPYLVGDKDMFINVCNFASCNLLIEKVTKNEIYSSIYSEKINVCPNDSYYWTTVNLIPSTEGQEWISDIKNSVKAAKIEALLKRGGVGKKAISQQRNDDDD